MKIGKIKLNIETPLYMAPMAGITDKTFRGICAELGADITCTEMVSAKALSYGNKNTKELLEKSEYESTVAVQIFGSDPEIMAIEAKKLEKEFDIIDINMGCPVQKIVCNGEGSSLMTKPELARDIVSEIVRAVNIPVTVKMRIGFDENHINAVSFAGMLEEAGASAIAVHGRTKTQMYSGKADWNMIKCVKSSVGIPVFGNGDVFSAEDALRMRDETGVDGIMVARGAQGNPWIFREMRAALDGRLVSRPSLEEKKQMVLRHADGLIEDKGEFTGVREMRKHLAWYTAGIKGSAAFRGATNYIESFEEMKKLVNEFFV